MVSNLLWPNNFWIVVNWVPLLCKSVAKLRLKVWGVILFLAKTSSLYAIEGSPELAKHLTSAYFFFNKNYLNYLAGLKSAKKPKSHSQELLKEGWKHVWLIFVRVLKN